MFFSSWRMNRKSWLASIHERARACAAGGNAPLIRVATTSASSFGAIFTLTPWMAAPSP